LVGLGFGGDYLLADPTIAQYGLICDRNLRLAFIAKMLI
jgi:hypothetical protein